MTDNALIEKLNSIMGQRIVDVSYIQTKFHYPLHSDWTHVNPDLFVLHAPEWQLKLSDGQTLFISGQQLTADNFASAFSIPDKTKVLPDETVLQIPKSFGWTDILDKPIQHFRLWQRIIKSSVFLGYEYNLKYQSHFQIIDLVCGNKIFSLTTMSGDIGDTTFYPTGYFGEKIGVYLNKTVCSSHTSYDGLTMRMAVTYQSK